MPNLSTTRIDAQSVDPLVTNVMAAIRCQVEEGAALSSETGLRFLFAWELGRALGFSPDYRFDFEFPAFSDLDTEDTFLDLLVWTDPSFRVAVEFKLPKRSSNGRGSPSTQARAKICRDISRLSHLVRTGRENTRVGYFICASDETAYLNAEGKTRNTHYGTFHGCVYKPGHVVPPGEGTNGIGRELPFPAHAIQFDWEGIEKSARGWRPSGRFAWLRPVRVSG